MANDLRWAISSTGVMAANFAKNLNYLDSNLLYAVASRSLDKANNFAKEHNVNKAYASLDEMLQDDNIDIVYLASPHMFHYEEALKVIKSGKHLLCEKAFTMNAKQAKEVIMEAKEHNVFVMEAMWTRFLPVYQKLKSLLQDRVIGDIKALKLDFITYRDMDPKHRLFNKELGGGALLDLGVYCLSVAQFIMGNPTNINSNVIFNECGTDQLASLLLTYENGAFAQANIGFSAKTDRSVYIMGKNGYIKVGSPFNASQELVLKLTGKEEEVFSYPFVEPHLGYIHEIKAVNEAISLGKTEIEDMSHQDTISIMEQMDSIRASWGFDYFGV